MLRLKDWREVIFEDWPKTEVTKRTVQRAIDYQGQVRKPLFLKEYEIWRAKICKYLP